MGLDNGIAIKRNEYSNKISALKIFVKDFDKEKAFDFDVCYWRKCWNVRRDIFNVIMIEKENSNYVFALSIDNIKGIIKVLKSYNAQTWKYGGWGGSIWEWNEHEKINRKHIKNLKKLIRLMKKYPDLEVYFYDSY